MKRVLAVLAAAVAVATTGLAGVSIVDPQKADAARLKSFTKTDTARQSNEFSPANGLHINVTSDPFTYSGVGKIRSLTELTITATLEGGGTGPGEIDEDNLTLALDGIDTGIKLNGFRNATRDTQTISGVPANARAILAALKANGKLQATIIDHTPDDNNMIWAPGGDIDTTLTIKGKRRR